MLYIHSLNRLQLDFIHGGFILAYSTNDELNWDRTGRDELTGRQTRIREYVYLSSSSSSCGDHFYYDRNALLAADGE